MRRLAILAVALALAAVDWTLQAAAETAPAQRPQPVGLAKLIASIPAGQPWAKFYNKARGIWADCIIPHGTPSLVWQSNITVIDRKTLIPMFAAELKSAGLVPADDPDNLFQKQRDEAADLQVAGNIKSISANLCAGYTQRTPESAIVSNLDGSYGDITMDIDWQVHSTSADKVIANLVIHSTFATAGHAPGGVTRLVQGGIRENLKALIASPAFRAAAMTTPSASAFQVAQQSKIIFAAPPTRSTKISDAVGSVVLILSGGGHGSGFLVSSDGYIMTAQHVVGADKYVKIRWSDGLEGVGEVIRTDKRRDVAILKAEPRGRAPLALHLAMPEPGDTVFAIGAPIDPKLQSTVTRGVASANRIMDGFSFIQSDVTVDPGNSGGPLLTEKGEVLGFTDKGLRSAEAPTGLNFFVPIRDALDFLSLEPR